MWWNQKDSMTNVRIEAHEITYVISDGSGYEFRVNTWQNQPWNGVERGWTGSLTIEEESELISSDAVLKSILVQAKEFVRMMDETVIPTR